MSTNSRRQQVPNVPRVISPSPDPSDASTEYSKPTTRSATRITRNSSTTPVISEDGGASPGGSSESDRARSRSRSPSRTALARRRASSKKDATASGGSSSTKKIADISLPNKSGTNGHLSPESANKRYWRELSRSPSPLGLIPIHQTWRSFIHRHEVPRKILHGSIGVITCVLYTSGAQPAQIHNVLLAQLIPITVVDVVRHHRPDLNRQYIRLLGALMRESEVDGWNGVISYLLGAWVVLRFMPKDVAVVSVLLLSWCDTAASTAGRRFGRYTPQIRRGKSLAGSVAAMVVGVGAAAGFWGWMAPRFGAAYDIGENAFAFRGVLTLPAVVRNLLGGLSEGQASVTGKVAVGVMSVWAGFVASASEAVDLFGWDDNLTIPVLCGAGLWGFLKIFG